MALLSALELEITIPVSAVIGIAFSLALWCLRWHKDKALTAREEGVIANCDNISAAVYAGAKSFMCKEYWHVGAFAGVFAILIFLCLGSVERFSTQSRPCKFDPSNTCKPALATAVFSTVSFLLGAFTSVVSGFLGTKIAIYANKRTVLEERNLVRRTSIAASGSGAVIGFLLAAFALLVLYLAIFLFKLYYGNDWEGLFEAITGYGLGGSFMALFGRVGGGIYAKAADVCNHLVQKIEPNIQPDDRNPAVIPNYVGDIVGDIAGMGPDLFASYAESSCAALVVASISSFGIDHDFTAMCYPLLINSMGILVCLITTLVGIIMPGLERHLIIISTILMTGGIFLVSWIALPSSFTIYNFGSQKVVKNWQLSLCVGVGLWAGLIIGFVKEIYTNKPFSCLQRVGSSVNVSLGSVTIPFFAAVCILVSSGFAGTYGIAVAALGMLSTIATRLAIDACGFISHNAEDVARMGGRIDMVRDTTGNTTTATRKGFAIESAALVSIALFGAFVSGPAMSSIDVLTPKIIIGLIIGAWLPHFFSAMTMESVGRAVFKMAPEVREKLNPGLDNLKPNNGPKYYKTFFEISTDASVRGVILPGAIVLLAPLVVGTVFGVEMLSGVLAGSLSSVVQIAISASKNDGAWNQAKEDIKVGALVKSDDSQDTLSKIIENVVKKIIENVVKIIGHSRKDTSGESGETTRDSGIVEIVERGETAGGENDEIEEAIGKSQKDTSGPPLNILIQLMAVESLVFAPFFAIHDGLLFKILRGRATDDFPSGAAAAM